MRVLAAMLVMMGVVGCGNEFPVYPVKGRVMFEGKPMIGGGSISLVPLDNRPGKTAGGTIAEDGTYTLSTNATDDGSMPGEFRVVIYQTTDTEPTNTGDGNQSANLRQTKSVPPADRIPEIYSDGAKSPLRATVEAKSDNEINFELKRSGQ
jgi:hypothetical protein